MRVRKTTHDMLKLVSVFSHESRVETIDRLARQELDGMSLDKIDAIIEALRYERYQWLPARRTYIPKKNGKKRPLGMPVWSDKLVQEVIHLILEAYYEPQFSDHSHGFRPERGCHTALREIYQQWTGTSWFKEGQDSATGEPCALKGACTVRRRADRKGLAEILPGMSPGKSKVLDSTSLAAYPTVADDLSQQQMVMKQHQERNKHLNRVVYDEWGFYTFLQMLTYKCCLYGKDLHFLDERDTSKICSGCGQVQAMPLWKRTYGCTECGSVMDRDDNSALNLLNRYFARREPHTDRMSVRCAEVFIATENVNIGEHI